VAPDAIPAVESTWAAKQAHHSLHVTSRTKHAIKNPLFFRVIVSNLLQSSAILKNTHQKSAVKYFI
jgi:hypothetical protein